MFQVNREKKPQGMFLLRHGHLPVYGCTENDDSISMAPVSSFFCIFSILSGEVLVFFSFIFFQFPSFLFPKTFLLSWLTTIEICPHSTQGGVVSTKNRQGEDSTSPGRTADPQEDRHWRERIRDHCDQLRPSFLQFHSVSFIHSPYKMPKFHSYACSKAIYLAS